MSEINVVTRERRDSRGIQDTNWKTENVSGQVRHHRHDILGEWIDVGIHLNQGLWFDTPKAAAEVSAQYLDCSETVHIGVGSLVSDVNLYMSVDQAKALQASLAEALDSIG